MPDDKVTSLREFVERVRRFRQLWNAPADKELWFRGEGKKYEKSLLRPKLLSSPREAENETDSRTARDRI